MNKFIYPPHNTHPYYITVLALTGNKVEDGVITWMETQPRRVFPVPQQIRNTLFLRSQKTTEHLLERVWRNRHGPHSDR